MNNYFFKYKIRWFDDYDNKEKTANGLVYGDCFSNIMDKISAYYGEKNIIEVIITATENEYVYEYELNEENN